MEDLTKILELVNTGRTALGKPALSKLPLAEPGTESCVLGRSLNRVVECDDFGGVREYYVRFHNRKAARKLARVWGTRLSDYWQRWRDDAGHWEVHLPEPLNLFVRRFDAGEIPELIRTRAIVPADGLDANAAKLAAAA